MLKKNQSIIDAFIPLAIEKNLMPIMEKTASKNELNISNNIDSNILSLVAGITKKGLFSQAESLEKAYLAYKKAQSMYSSMLDFAHPDGNTKVNESGEFHTLQSTQEHMLAALQPKYKSAADDLLGMVKNALSVKIGQDSVIKLNPVDIVSPENPTSGGDNVPEGKMLTDEQQAIQDKLDAKINEVKSWLIENRDKIISGLSPEYIQSKIVFDNLEEDIINGTPAGQFYCSINGINQSEASEWLKNKYKYFKKSGSLNQEDVKRLLALIINNSKNEAPTLSQIPPEFHHYLFGVIVPDELRGEFQKANKSVGQENPESVFIYEGGDMYEVHRGRAEDVANRIIGSINTKYAQIISTPKYNTSIEAAHQRFEIYKGWLSGSFGEISTIYGQTLADVMNSLKQMVAIQKLFAPNIPELLSNTFPEIINQIPAFFNGGIMLLKSLEQFLQAPENQLFGSNYQGNAIVSYKDLGGGLIEWANAWRAYGKSLPLSKEKDEAKNNENFIKKLVLDLKNSTTLQQFNSKWGSIFKSPEDLQEYIANIKSNSQAKIPEQFRKSASNKEINIKLAQQGGAPGLEGGSKPKTPGAAPAGGGSKPSGNAVGQARNPQVQAMQFALTQYAGTLMGGKKTDGSPMAKDEDVVRMISVGRAGGTVNDMDGVWGSQTTGALTSANKFISGAPLIISPKDINVDAKKNTDLLVLANNYVKTHGGLKGEVSGSGGAQDIELDRIGMVANPGGGAFDTESNAFGDGSKVLRASNLATLKSLYTFLTSQGLIYPTTVSEGDKGFSVLEWGKILGGLSARANQKMENPRSEKEYSAATNYKRMMNNLNRQFLSFMSARNVHPPYTGYENYIISESSLDNFRAPGQKRPGFGDNTSVDGQKPSKGNGKSKGGRSGGLGMEGTTYETDGQQAGYFSDESGNQYSESGQEKTAETLPFSKTINFNNPWWSEAEVAQEYPNQFLSLKNFAASKATVRAQMLFSNDEDEATTTKEVQEQYINNTRGAIKVDPVNAWDGTTYWIIPAGQRDSVPLSEYPHYQRNLSLLQNFHVLDKYRNYLNALKRGLTASYQEWLQSGPSEAIIEQVQTFHQRWLEAINNQNNQINTTLKGYKKR